MCQNQGELVAIIGFVKGVGENLAKFTPAKPVETAKPLV